jgi:hypothetical protein
MMTGRGDSQTLKFMSDGSTLANLPLSPNTGGITSLKAGSQNAIGKGKKAKKTAKVEPEFPAPQPTQPNEESGGVNETENEGNLMTHRELWKPINSADLEKGPSDNEFSKNPNSEPNSEIPSVLADICDENLGVLRAIIDGYGPKADAIMQEFRKDTPNGLLQMPEKDFILVPVKPEIPDGSKKSANSHKNGEPVSQSAPSLKDEVESLDSSNSSESAEISPKAEDSVALPEEKEKEGKNLSDLISGYIVGDNQKSEANHLMPKSREKPVAESENSISSYSKSATPHSIKEPSSNQNQHLNPDLENQNFQEEIQNSGATSEEAEVVFQNKNNLLGLSEDNEEELEKDLPRNEQKEDKEEEKELPLDRAATPLIVASMHSSDAYNSDSESSKSPSKDDEHLKPGLPLPPIMDTRSPGQTYRDYWKVRPSCSQETSHRLGRPISVDSRTELNRTYSQDESDSQSVNSKNSRRKPRQHRRPGQMRRPRRRNFSGIPPDLKFDFSGIES